METPLIEVRGLRKNFDDVTALSNIDLSIKEGEFFSLLGSSGCGKSTLLRILAGFEQPTEGRVFIQGKDVTDLPPYERPLNMMFQSYALFPHLSVFNNVAYGLKRDRIPKAEIATRVEEICQLMQISKLMNRKPHQLSGGQRQRVALARALVKRAKILLLDEPLGALDKKLREDMQFELVNLQEMLKMTFVVVTHDQEEAMTMSSRVALLNDGLIEQVDTPRRLYEYPATRYAASFVGLSNLFEAKVVSHDDDLVTLWCDALDAELSVRHAQPLVPDMVVTVLVRPEKVSITAPDAQADNSVVGVIENIAYLGDVSIYYCNLPNGQSVKFTQANVQPAAELPLDWGQKVRLGWRADTCNVLVA